MIRLKVDGMSCQHCVHAVDGALRAFEGVERVEVDLEAGAATVEGTPDPAALIAAIEHEGYKAEVEA